MTDTATTSAPTSQPFQAEVAELLNLMVHSVYSETDIFLRELISNASDACDKLRYEAIANPHLIAEGASPNITIAPDKEASILSVIDSGIGMDRQELIDNLGTIARSGTKSFLSRLTEAKDGVGLIGQFGVGFYAAFMVADRIVVTSRRAGEHDAFTWTSSGGAGFEIAQLEDGMSQPAGTRIDLHLKEDAKNISRRTRSSASCRPIPTTSSSRSCSRTAIPSRARSIPPARCGSARNRADRGRLHQAYKSIASAWDEPAMTLHYRAEGRYSYAVLLFAPSAKPFDLFEPNRKGKVKLYVRRVFITDDADLLPTYLRFIRGVIDAEDLPLNLSREMLQNNPQLAQIRKAVATRVVGELDSMSEKEPEASPRSGTRSAR